MAITLNGSSGEIFPSWTTAGRPASPTPGQTGFNSTLGQLETWNGAYWMQGGGATGAGSDQVFYLNGQTVNTSYSIPSGKSAHSVGPVTLATGVVVTIPAGSRYIIL